MNLLKIDFGANNLFLHQIKRTEKKAMYSVHQEKDGPIVGYEVIEITILPEREHFGHTTPEHEHYPGNEEFGTLGFSWCTREQAEKCFAEIAT